VDRPLKSRTSFCRKVSLVLAEAKAAPTSFLAVLEEVIAKRPSRPGRKELRGRDKPLKVKTKKTGQKAKPFAPKTKEPTPKKKPEAAPKEKKQGNIDQYGNFSLKGLEEEEKKEAEQKEKQIENLPALVEQEQEEKEPDDREIFEGGDSKSSPQLTALRSMDDPHLFLVNFRNTEEKKPLLQKLQPMFNPRSFIVFYAGRKNDPELSQFYAFLVAGGKQGDFSNILGKLDHEAQGLPDDFLSHDAPFDELVFGPEFKKLGVNEAKVKRELNQVIKQISSNSSQGQVSALRMMSEIPIDYVRFLNPDFSQREFYIGGNPPNAGTKGTRLVLCEEKESARFLKVMEFFKPMNTFFNDLYFVNDIDPDFKDYKPFKIVPARALLLEAKTKFEIDKEVEVEGGKVELLDGKTGEPIKPTQFEFLKKFVEEKMSNIAKQGNWKKARYYEGDNWIHLNRDHTKAILWGARTKSISLSKKDILDALPFVKNVNLTFLK